ncbi:hypothetical protein N825_11440 [Skermanella stibiiresistens SB22]|jgi:hypothetical protein|uniref:Uncharacterized protein n=1 Tax=Skermanella stibiiresistens SB22 TaxID=1385369 RepID=W9H4Y0_9PROT|nr:hypothetical protein [Skermanella stibiiresistens]EWY38818.1 hypothetical protein N825_11440 [Skermanella stibiiresistens SB22]
MGIVIELGKGFGPEAEPERGIPELAERVADACRNRLLERKAAAVSFNHISEQLGIDPRLVPRAVAWLERNGRAEVRDFKMRSRPHVTVLGICRIDDIDMCPPT